MGGDLTTKTMAISFTVTSFSTVVKIRDTADFNTAIADLSADTLIIGEKTNGLSPVIDLAGESVKFYWLNNVQFENIKFINGKYIKVDNSSNVKFVNVTLENFIQNGFYIYDSSDISITNSKFDNIGSTNVNPTWQGNGVYVSDTTRLTMTNNEISGTYGQGGIFLINSQDFLLNDNNIHDTFYRGISMYSGTFTGIIENNNIQDIGSINTTDSGVTCNGIFGTGDDLSGVSVLNNYIKNVLENGIEGKYGLVEGNYVDGTGIDIENHPTPSGEGIYANSTICRNNTVKNTQRAGIKVHSNGSIKNKTIEYNTITKDVFDAEHFGIAIISDIKSYSNVLVRDNIITNYSGIIVVHQNYGGVIIIGNTYFIV